MGKARVLVRTGVKKSKNTEKTPDSISIKSLFLSSYTVWDAEAKASFKK